MDARGYCVGGKVQGAGQRKWIGHQLERVTQVDDEDRVAGIHLALEFVGLEA